MSKIYNINNIHDNYDFVIENDEIKELYFGRKIIVDSHTCYILNVNMFKIYYSFENPLVENQRLTVRSTKEFQLYGTDN